MEKDLALILSGAFIGFISSFIMFEAIRMSGHPCKEEYVKKGEILEGLRFMKSFYETSKRIRMAPLEFAKWQSECQHDPEKAYEWMLDSDIEILTAAIEYISRT